MTPDIHPNAECQAATDASYDFTAIAETIRTIGSLDVVGLSHRRGLFSCQTVLPSWATDAVALGLAVDLAGAHGRDGSGKITSPLVALIGTAPVPWRFVFLSGRPPPERPTHGVVFSLGARPPASQGG